MALLLSSVSWKEHSNTLSTICKDLINNFFVDCTISSGCQCLKAHRLILSACSPYFHMLFSEEREKHSILILKDVSFDTLKSVIDFVYRGEIQIPKGDLKAFLELAESLQIKGLNDSSMKDVCESFICDASRDVCEGPSSDNQKNILEAQSSSVNHASTEHPLHHSYGYSDTVQINSCPTLEESNRAPEKEKSILEMALSQEKNVPVLPSEKCEDTEIKVKEEPLQPECVVVKCEQIEECDELIQEDNTDDAEECRTPPFTNQNMDQYPTIASTHMESANVVPDAVRVPQMIQPPNPQGVAATYTASTSGLPDAVRIPQMIGPAKTPDNSKTETLNIPSASTSPRSDTLEHDQTQSAARKRKSTQKYNECTALSTSPGAEYIIPEDFQGPHWLTGQPRQPPGSTSFLAPLEQLVSASGEAFPLSGGAGRPRRKLAGELPHACDECGKAFKKSSTLVRHKRTHTGERPYVCDLCGKAFKESGTLACHKRRHAGERPYPCDVCGKAFSESTSLATHIRTHTGERPYVCDMCGKAFTQSSTLAIHKRSHTGERPYVCDLCGKAFTQSGALLTHKRRHAGDRRYACDVCGKAFAESGDLNCHKRSHTKERPYACDVCGKTFSRPFILATHKRMHTGERPYTCDMCDKAFAQSGSLIAHRRTHT